MNKLYELCDHLNITEVLQPSEAISLIHTLTFYTHYNNSTGKCFLNILHTTLLPFYKRIRKILSLRSFYKGKYDIRRFKGDIERVSNIFNEGFPSYSIIVWDELDDKSPIHIVIPSLNKKHIILLLILFVGKCYYVQKRKQYPKTVKFIKESPKRITLEEMAAVE